MIRWILAVTVVTGLLLAERASAQPKLELGSPAPQLKASKWVKGKPVEKFEKGKVYVVEFWATWCGPCVQSIPHVTEMAKKFEGKVTFVGMNVWDYTDQKKKLPNLKEIEKFVKTMGNKMDYTVAVDSEDFMADNWLAAAGEDGIPAAFIVDGTGKVVWIGHPMNAMDKVLDQVLAGKYDYAAEAKKRVAERKRQDQIKALYAKVEKLVAENKYKEALTEIKSATEKDKELTGDLFPVRCQLELQVDPKAGLAFMKKAAEGEYKDDAGILNMMATYILGADLKKQDFSFAVTMATRANELTKSEEPYVMDTLAFAYYKQGDKAKAIEWGDKALKLVEKDKEADQELKKYFQERLSTYKGSDK